MLSRYGLRFAGRLLRTPGRLVRFRCRDGRVGLGSPPLQVFQEIPRTADEFHVVARRKPERESDFFYERHAIFLIKIVRWLRIFLPTIHESKHSAILRVADPE